MRAAARCVVVGERVWMRATFASGEHPSPGPDCRRVMPRLGLHLRSRVPQRGLDDADDPLRVLVGGQLFVVTVGPDGCALSELVRDLARESSLFPEDQIEDASIGVFQPVVTVAV